MKKITLVEDLVCFLDEIIPPEYAEGWDNVGLQIGNLKWKINKIWTTLDPTINVVKKACKEKVNFLITHHPLFLKPIKKINTNESIGKIIDLSLHNKLAIFSIHTNFDYLSGGVNDILCAKIGLLDIKTIKIKRNNYYKLIVYIPENKSSKYKKNLKTLLSYKFVGKLENYSHCSFRDEGIVEKEPKPNFGSIRNLSEVKKTRIETIVSKKKLNFLINSLKMVHPYESINYDIYPLISENSDVGLSRIGKMFPPISLVSLIKKIKFIFNLKTIKISGNIQKTVKYISLCCGSSPKDIQYLIKSKAEVYISGDISYHNARSLEENGLTVIDLGHFNSEYIAMETLADQLKNKLYKNNDNRSIYISSPKIEADVFNFI